jgi:hypothetical protein
VAATGAAIAGAGLFIPSSLPALAAVGALWLSSVGLLAAVLVKLGTGDPGAFIAPATLFGLTGWVALAVVTPTWPAGLLMTGGALTAGVICLNVPRLAPAPPARELPALPAPVPARTEGGDDR